MLEDLENYFKNTPREEIEAAWAKSSKYDFVGPTVEEYLNFLNNTNKMTIENFKWVSPTNTEYTLNGIIELFPNTGFNFIRLTKINGKEEDSVIIRNQIKHDDILNHIKQLNHIEC